MPYRISRKTKNWSSDIPNVGSRHSNTDNVVDNTQKFRYQMSMTTWNLDTGDVFSLASLYIAAIYAWLVVWVHQISPTPSTFTNSKITHFIYICDQEGKKKKKHNLYRLQQPGNECMITQKRIPILSWISSEVCRRTHHYFVIQSPLVPSYVGHNMSRQFTSCTSKTYWEKGKTRSGVSRNRAREWVLFSGIYRLFELYIERSRAMDPLCF